MLEFISSIHAYKTRIMAKKNFFAIAMMIAMVISFSACTEGGILGLDGEAIFDVNGGEGEDITYELVTEHIGFAIEGDILLDDHDAVLLKNGEEVERHAYAGEFLLSHNEVTLKRSVAEKLQQDTIVVNNGGFDLNGVAVLTISLQLQNCDEVYCNENGKTYCHPQFAEQNKDAVPALNLCNPQRDTLFLHTIEGDILNGDVNIEDQKWPVKIIVTDDDVRTVDYSDAKVISADEVEIIKTVKVNGSVVETSPIRVAYHATLECGGLISTNDLTPLAYGSDSNVNGEMVTINMNIVSFTASVDMPATVSFEDEGSSHTAKVVYNSLYVTSNGDIKVVNNSTENIDILNTAYFKLVCDGINMAEDDKLIRQTSRVYAEFEKEEEGIIYFILHEKEDIRFTAPSGILLVAGTDDEFVVENLELSQTGRNEGSWKATKTSTVNGVKFTSYERNDIYSYSHGITNTVNVTKNDDFIIIHNGHEYAVKINEVSIAAAAPVAGNVTTDNVYKTRPYTLAYTASRNNTKAEDETIFTLKVKEDVLGWEVDDYATVTDRNTVSINAYETRNGDRTGRVETLTAGYSANLVAGTIEPKTSQDILRLMSTTATMSGSKAYFNYTLGSENFQGEWSWSASSNATFTLPDGQQTTKPVKADYSVRSTDLSIDGNVYSNAASLYADNIAVAEDVQKIQVVRADIEGYEAISGFLTTWYRNINGALISQGNIIVVNYRNISDKNKNILVVRDASNGQEVMRENANNIAAETILSVVYGNNGMSVATLIGVTSTNNQPKDWRYKAINNNAALTVDEMAVVTQRLPNPYIAYATVENGGLKLGNFIFY